MKKRIVLLLAFVLLLSGCGKRAENPVPSETAETQSVSRFLEPTETVPETEAAESAVPETEGALSSEQPILLPPEIGSFFFCEDGTDGQELFPEDPAGDHYGFKDNYFSGCSVWCAVQSLDCTAFASSYLAPMGKYTYEPGHLIDGDRNTVWSEGVSGTGRGEAVTIRYCFDKDYPDPDKLFSFNTLCIVNGYAQTEQKWRDNGRVRSMELYVNGKRQYCLTLADTIQPQYFDISGAGLTAAAGEETEFLFVITDVYPGDKYDDTVLTGIELEFWTPNH